MFLPSKLLYQISSGSLCRMSAEQLVVDVRDPCAASPSIMNEIADVRLRRDRRRDRRRVRRRRVRHDACGPSVIASTLPVAIVRRFRFALPCSAETTMQRRRVLRPDDRLPLCAARRGLIAADAAADIEVVGLREVPRRAAGRCVDDEQIGLAVGTDRIAVEASRRMRFDVHRATRVGALIVPSMLATFVIVAASGRHAVQIGVGRLVVRLGHARGYEVDLRTVRRPLDLALVVLAVGDLLWSAVCRRSVVRDREDVRVAPGIDVSRIAVGAIHRARDHLDVALRLLRPSHPSCPAHQRRPVP